MTTPTPTQYYDGLTKSKLNMDRFDQFINGDAYTDVQTDNGPIPTLRKGLMGTTIAGIPGLSDAIGLKADVSALNEAIATRQPTAYVGKYKFNILTKGAVGNNSGNQATAINSAIADATAVAATSGGADVIFPDGVYRTTGEIRVGASGVNLVAESNAEIRPVGNFSTIRFESATPQSFIYRNHLSGLILSETGKTGGLSLEARYVAQSEFDIRSFLGWNGVEIESFNTISLTGRIESIRGGGGARYIRLLGGRYLGTAGSYNARSDAASIQGMTIGGSRSSGVVGILIDGFVHTATFKTVWATDIGDDALLTENFAGATNIPSFLRFIDFQSDGPTKASARLNYGVDIWFTLPHFNRSNTTDGMIVSDQVKDYGVIGGQMVGNTGRGFVTSGTGGSFQGVQIYENSNNEFGGTVGTNVGFLLGASSKDTVMNGCRSGKRGSSVFQSYAGQIDTGCDSYCITGNDFKNNVNTGINNGTTPNSTNRILANNTQ